MGTVVAGVITPEEAVSAHLIPGLGVQFVELGDEEAKRLEELLTGTPTLTMRIGDPPATPSALLVADASAAGYTNFPLSLGADQSFAVSGVPAGSYFLALDATTTSVALCGPGQTPVPIHIVNFFELMANAPDLANVTSTRPDVVVPQSAPTVTFDVSPDPVSSSTRGPPAYAPTRYVKWFPPIFAQFKIKSGP